MNGLGQCFFTGISGTTLTSEEEKFLEKEDIGGVILFGENYESPAQLAELVNSIQRCRTEFPLFIGVDYEGGRVQRFKEPFTIIPSARSLAKLDSPKMIFHVSKIIAQELSACGINVNFAPVCDISGSDPNTIVGDRAYGDSAKQVSKYISSVIRGLQTSSVLACAKHFPGHGCTETDSHFGIPIVKKPLEELEDSEIIPFVKAIKSRVELLMMSHITLDSLDESAPCSLSPKVYSYIREKLKYTKLFITDDMGMGAITKKYSPEEASLMALEAGADILLNKSFEITRTNYEFLKLKMKTKELKNDLIKEKVLRISEVKKSNFKEYKPIYIPEITKKVGMAASQILVDEINSKILESEK